MNFVRVRGTSTNTGNHVLCGFSETWLHDNIPDSTVDLPNFNIVRGDRSLDSGKSKGGGVCLYINNAWCNNWSVKERFCTPDYELLTVGLRHYYLPREFNQIVVMAVYVQPRANFQVASEAIASRIQRLESTSPDSAKFVLGDFNHCRLDQVLPSYHRFVNKPTRGHAVLDLCYGTNIASAYKERVCPKLGNSDHNIIQLLPSYKQALKQSKPTTVVTRNWSTESKEQLRGCFECTDWSVLVDCEDSIDTIVTTVNDYIKFCIDSVMPLLRKKVYPNNKPWVSRKLKPLLEKRNVFAAGCTERVKGDTKRH